MALGNELILTDEDGPDVNEGEQNNVGDLVQGEDEREDVIGHALRETVNGMESMARIRCGHDPSMMWLVQILVDSRVVQASMDPIDEKVGEENEERKLEDIVQGEWCIGQNIVQLGVSSHFTNKKGDGKDGHDRKGGRSLLYLQRDLVFEIFGVGESGMVEHEEVGQGGADEVDDKTEEPKDFVRVPMFLLRAIIKSLTRL